MLEKDSMRNVQEKINGVFDWSNVRDWEIDKPTRVAEEIELKYNQIRSNSSKRSDCERFKFLFLSFETEIDRNYEKSNNEKK